MSESLAARLRALPRDGARAWMGRPAAVLMAFSPAGMDGDLDVILVRRPDFMRHHAGQVSFPGGALEEGDADAVAAALREAREEVGIDPAWVEVLGSAGRIPVAVSGFDVELVLGLWDGAGPLVASPREVDGILRPTLRQLADPANQESVPLADLIGLERARARQLPPDARSPVFRVDGNVVWGFTAGVLSELLASLGLPAPPLPPAWPRSAAAQPPVVPTDPATVTRPGP